MIHTGDCVAVMAAMPENSVDAIVCDPPYGLEFMGKEWDRLESHIGNPNMKPRGQAIAKEWNGINAQVSPGVRKRVPWCKRCGKFQFAPGPSKCHCKVPDWNARTDEGGRQMQGWHEAWATEALRVAKPGAYLLAFGGTRTYHRLAVAVEDAGWIIRDCLVWAYAQGFPKSRALLKPAWEPIVMARKPGPLRELAIDACRLPANGEKVIVRATEQPVEVGILSQGPRPVGEIASANALGRWPANVLLTATEDGRAIFDGNIEGVVGGGETSSGKLDRSHITAPNLTYGQAPATLEGVYEPDTGTYSRFFLIPKSARAEREPVAKNDPNYIRSDGIVRTQNNPRKNHHPTVKPLDLMRHLVRLVTPSGGTVLDPFLGSGTTAIAAEMEGFAWIGIEREPEYVAIAEARLMGVQKGLGLDVPAPTPKPVPHRDGYWPPADGLSESSFMAGLTGRKNRTGVKKDDACQRHDWMPNFDVEDRTRTWWECSRCGTVTDEEGGDPRPAADDAA